MLLVLISETKAKILIPKLPMMNIIKPINSEYANLKKFPVSIPAILARESLTQPTLSGESIIEWINQKGEKIINFCPISKLVIKIRRVKKIAKIKIYRYSNCLLNKFIKATSPKAPKTNTDPYDLKPTSDPSSSTEIKIPILLFIFSRLIKDRIKAIIISSETAKGGLRLKEIDWLAQNADSPPKVLFFR